MTALVLLLVGIAAAVGAACLLSVWLVWQLVKLAAHIIAAFVRLVASL